MPKECAVCKKQAQLAAQITRGSQTATVFFCESCVRRVSQKMPVTVIASGVSSLPKGTVLSPNRSAQPVGQPVTQPVPSTSGGMNTIKNTEQVHADRPKPMFCGVCGTRLQPGSSFCSSCGTPAGSYTAPKMPQMHQGDSPAQPEPQRLQPVPTQTAVPVPAVNIPQNQTVRENPKQRKKGGARAFVSVIVIIGIVVVLLHAARNMPDRPSDATERNVRMTDTAVSSEPVKTEKEEKTPETVAAPESTIENDASEGSEPLPDSDSTVKEDAQELVNDVNSLLSGLGEILSSAADDAKEAVSSADDGTSSQIVDELIDEAVDYIAEKTDLVIRPEYKEAIDSYEAFFDEYVDFMTLYSESDNPFSMLAEYMEYMTKLSDCMEKLDALEDDAANNAETAYFLEAQLRINKKLLSISDP